VLQADEGTGTSPVVQAQEAVEVDQSALVSSVPMARNAYTASSAHLGKKRARRLYPLVILMRVAIGDEFPVQLRNGVVASLPSCDELGQMGINVS